ncbi:hypothetical protein Tco_1271032, partial [Tanacetum coccineum]
MKMNIWTTSSDCSKEQKVIDESNHGANFAVKWVDTCETCLENGKNLCKFENSNELQFEVKNEANEADVRPEANSSFLSSVMNMIGMLI